MKTSSIAVETSRSISQSDSIVRQTNKRSFLITLVSEVTQVNLVTLATQVTLVTLVAQVTQVTLDAW